MEEHWHPRLLVHLRNTTRDLQFDWKAVESSVQHFAAKEFPGESFTINAASCRYHFANDYSVESVVDINSEAAARITEEAAAAASAPPVQPTNYDSLSLEELIAHVDATEVHLRQRKEEIFKRVLTSLGGEASQLEAATAMVGEHSSESIAAAQDYDTTRQAYIEILAERDAQRAKREILAVEHAERLRLDADRETLRRRFEEGSADAVGEDPLSEHAGGSAQYKSTGTAYPGEKRSAEMEFIDSLPYNPGMTQALERYMETEEFDIMLTDLERELEAMAPSKDASKISLYFLKKIFLPIFLCFISIFTVRCSRML
jgi:hypothetical protein